MNAPIGSWARAKPARVTANDRKPSWISRRWSQATNTVPIASPPRHAPSPQVAYSHLYVEPSSSMPKFSRATVGNRPTNGREISEKVNSVSSKRSSAGRRRAMRMPEVNARIAGSFCTRSCGGRWVIHRAKMTNR